MFITEMFIFQSKANLDEKTFLLKLHIFKPQKLDKMLVWFMFGNENSTFHSGL